MDLMAMRFSLPASETVMKRAEEIDLKQMLVLLILFPFFCVGWLAGLFWRGLRIAIAAASIGFQEGNGVTNGSRKPGSR